MATDELRQPTPPRHPSGLQLIDSSLIEAHLEDIELLDRGALLDVLVPNRYLPEHDPAAYVIRAHNAERYTDKGVAVHDSYDLGVAFGRSLVEKAYRRAGALLPVVSDLDPDNKNLVDEYLHRSQHKKLTRLIKHDDELHPEITPAVVSFVGRCEAVIPSKMYKKGAAEEVHRGVHDFLSVIDILEGAPERSKVRRRLGGGALMLGGLALGFKLISRRNTNPHSAH